MPTYTVKAIEETKRDDNGNWSRHKATLENDRGQTKDVSIFVTKANGSPPKAGDKVDGEIVPNEKNPSWLPEFKLPRRGAGGGFSGPRPEDPKKTAGIRRMHCQKLALELVKLGLETALIEKPNNFGDLLQAFYLQADELDNDVKRASDAG